MWYKIFGFFLLENLPRSLTDEIILLEMQITKVRKTDFLIVLMTLSIKISGLLKLNRLVYHGLIRLRPQSPLKLFKHNSKLINLEQNIKVEIPSHTLSGFKPKKIRSTIQVYFCSKGVFDLTVFWTRLET